MLFNPCNLRVSAYSAFQLEPLFCLSLLRQYVEAMLRDFHVVVKALPPPSALAKISERRAEQLVRDAEEAAAAAAAKAEAKAAGAKKTEGAAAAAGATHVAGAVRRCR